MKTVWTFTIICLFMIGIPGLAQDSFGQVARSGDGGSARVRIQPERTEPVSPSQPVRAMERILPPAAMAPPVRYLWGDFDGDGLEDLFVLDMKGNLLFRNLGDGGFEEITGLAFPDGALCGLSGFLGDYNGDERSDLFLFHTEGFTLFENEGKMRFSDVTERLGLDSKLPVSGVRLKDYDGDGDEDLLVQTLEGDRIFRNSEGREFNEVPLSFPDRRTSGTKGTVPPMLQPGGPASPDRNSSGGFTFDGIYVNDNSPGSVGVGVPEVEGGDDASVLNDIVDGTVTGEDMAIGSVQADRIAGTAATLTGDQNFDSGTLFINSSNDFIGMGTTNPTAELEVKSPDVTALKITSVPTEPSLLLFSNHTENVWSIQKDTMGDFRINEEITGFPTRLYIKQGGNVGIGTTIPDAKLDIRASTTTGLIVESFGDNKKAIEAYATPTSSQTTGVYGRSNSTEGIGVWGRASATSGTTYGVYGESESPMGRGVQGLASASSGNNVGVRGVSYSTAGTGVAGWASATSGITSGVWGGSESPDGYGVSGSGKIGVRGASDSAEGIGVYGHESATGGLTKGVYGVSYSNQGYGLYGYATATTGTTYGVFGKSDSPDGRGVYGTAPNYGVYGLATEDFGVNYGVYGESLSVHGRGVYGYASSTEYHPYASLTGVYGLSDHEKGKGVWGRASATSGQAHGVYGSTTATSGAGVYGSAQASSGQCYGVRGHCSSPDGYGGYFDGRVSTDVLIIRGGSDLSERFDIRGVEGETTPSPGMVVCIDPENPGKLVVSQAAYDLRVAGIVSGAGGVNTGMLMGQEGSVADGKSPVALTGRVYCLADASKHPIEPGDLLTTSDLPGHAMKVSDHVKAQGAILGKAMSSLESGQGLVLVLVTLQ